MGVITGGASGIGEATARLFSKHGAKVVIADIQDNLAKNVCKDLGSAAATFVHCDVTNESDVEKTVDTALDKYGKLDIMFNNAGIFNVGDTNTNNILKYQLSDFEHVIKVNLIGAFLGTKHAARAMIPNRGGSIISTGSVCSVMGGAAGHAYTSSKHGLVGLTKNVAVELGHHGIRVNCVSPYMVATPLAKKFLKLYEEGCRSGVYSSFKLEGNDCVIRAQDVGEAALYLASEESKYVSGHNLLLDGAFSIHNAAFSFF